MKQSVDEMLDSGASVQDVLVTMRGRDKVEQDRVWSEGLHRLLSRITAKRNRSAGTVVERVHDGQMSGLFFDPLEIAETYIRAELRRSRSREDGERKRQNWLMDVLVAVGEARIAGAATLAEYPPAMAMMEEAEAVG